MDQKNIDKVWLCEYVGKIKGVGQLTIAKMNDLRIDTIADLQLHVYIFLIHCDDDEVSFRNLANYLIISFLCASIVTIFLPE